MAPFEVRLERRAEEEFAKLPAGVRKRFYAFFKAVETDPYRPRPGCDIRILKGHSDIRAVRVGEYRAIDEVVKTEVWFTKFGHRSTVYSP